MKPPAFQFYADDFIGGTVTMTNEERGLYIMCLCIQWTQGYVDDADVAYLAGGMNNPSIERVKRKLVRGEDGKLRNARLEAERAKQEAWRAKCSNGGKKSGETRKGSSRVVELPCEVNGQVKGNTPLSTLHSPIKDKIGRFAPPSQGEVEGYALEIRMAKPECEKFINYYESNGWKVGRNPMKSWKAAMRNWKNNSYGHNASTGKPGVDRNAGTANEGKADQYAGVGRVVPLPNKG